jgi:mannose-6-phosphate isomerase-like protein (cupin superfamily)
MPVFHSIHPRFTLFRADDAIDFDESGVMTSTPLTDTQLVGATATVEAGVMDGATVKLLFAMPGMSLTHAWFKSGFPLPRHTHNGDCLYYILAGTLRIGTEELGKGDGFLVGAGVPYAYTPGPQGVEVLEFRGSNAFDIRVLADNPAFWERAVATVEERHAAWAKEAPPSQASTTS